VSLTHLDATGRARMVDVGDKPVTTRRAIAEGRVMMSAEAFAMVRDATVAKGDVIAGVTEIYGRTPAQLASVAVDVALIPVGAATAVTTGRGDLDDIKTTASGSSRGSRIEIPLGNTPPGDYIVRATVKSGRETVAELLRDVTITAGSVAPPGPPGPPGPPAVDSTTAASAAPAGVFEPRAVLEGELGRRFIARLRERSIGKPLAAAAESAFQLKWDRIEAALSPGASASFEGQALKGLSRFAARDFAAAATAWKFCFDREPASAIAGFLLGWAHAAAGDDRSAIGAWRAAVVADQTLVSAYLALVDAYLRLNEPDLARQVARSGVKALPKSVELRDRLQKLEKR